MGGKVQGARGREGKGVGKRGGEGKFRGARPPKCFFLEPRLHGMMARIREEDLKPKRSIGDTFSLRGAILQTLAFCP